MDVGCACQANGWLLVLAGVGRQFITIDYSYDLQGSSPAARYCKHRARLARILQVLCKLNLQDVQGKGHFPCKNLEIFLQVTF